MSNEEPKAPVSAASKLFDLRVLIGGLFTLYGLVLTVVGVLATQAALAKAAGININLWMGLGMLLLGMFFLLWWRLRPLRREPPPSD
jgi:hypothetical protein